MTPRAENPKDAADEAVARFLDRVVLEDPPADLKQNVLRAIGARPEPARLGWFESLRAGVRRRLLPQLVPFAAGAVAGVIVLAMASQGWRAGRDAAPLDGVMAPYGAVTAESPGRVGTRVDDQRFELGRANVRFEVFRPSGRSGPAHPSAVVAVTTDAASPVEITIRLASGGRVERILAAPTGPGAAEYGPDWVRIRQSGRERVEIGIQLEGSAAGAPIAIAVSSGGMAVQGALHAEAAAPTARQ